MHAAGTVTELHRWPVKSMGGEPVPALRVDGRGVGGDRTYALFDVHRDLPRQLTARQAPRLLAWSASYPSHPAEALDPGDPPLPQLRDAAGRTWTWGDPALVPALSADLGRDVTPQREPRGQQDLPDTVLITVQASLTAAGEELGRPLDLRRFRTNVHLELDASPFAEERWEGRRIRIGEAELELLHPCERCAIPTRDPDTQEKWAGLLRHLHDRHDQLFGINARPLHPATIRVGDRAELA